MTNEEKDKARGDEAVRIHEHDDPWFLQKTVRTAARLAREGWMPPETVDPDVLFVREVFAERLENAGSVEGAQYTRSGADDALWIMEVALAVLRAERERVAALEPKADEDGWIPHDGKGQPVTGDVRVEVRIRDGVTFRIREGATLGTDTLSRIRSVTAFSDAFNWTHTGSNDDIIAWRRA